MFEGSNSGEGCVCGENADFSGRPIHKQKTVELLLRMDFNK